MTEFKNSGNAAFEKKDFETALKQYDIGLIYLNEMYRRKCIAQQPASMPSRGAIRRMLLRMDYISERARDIVSPADLELYAQLHCNAATALLQLGRNKEAVRRSRVAVEASPNYMKAWQRLHSAYTALGRHADAKQVNEQCGGNF